MATNADEIPGIQRGTSPSASVDNAAKVSWAADHRGETDPKKALADQYNKKPLTVPLPKS